MRIHSQFKDYYDYVAHLYGGGDPSILYLRKRLAPLVSSGGSLYTSEVIVQHKGIRGLPRVDDRWHNHQGFYYSFKWLAVCGKYYLLTRKNVSGEIGDRPWRILCEEEHLKLVERLTAVRRFTENRDMSYWIADFQQPLVELSRKVNAPVFTFHVYRDEDQVMVDGEVPILEHLDFHRFYKAEQLYQDMSYFMGNQIKESPDMAPRSDMSDKERILQHGFDIKQSFRHRK